MALNTISIQGRLTKDVELRYTKSGKPVASFTLAVDRDGRDAGTDFINCVAWNNTALFVDKYFAKGSAALVTGRLQIRNYEDKNGNKRTIAEVIANSVYFAGEKKNSQAVNENTDYPVQPVFEPMDNDGDLPF